MDTPLAPAIRTNQDPLKVLRRWLNAKGLVAILLWILLSIILTGFALLFRKTSPLVSDYCVAISTGVFVGIASNLIASFIARKEVEEHVDLTASRAARAALREFSKGINENLAKAGIVDSFISLAMELQRTKIADCQQGEIIFMKIFIPNIEALLETLREAIDEHQRIVRILLWNPDSTDALQRRGQGILMDSEYQRLEILRNIKILEDLRKKLRNPDNLQVRVHTEFISVSLLGYGDDLVVGFYLSGRRATDGVQIKVTREGSFYKELMTNFEYVWSRGMELAKWHEGKPPAAGK